MSRSLKVRWLSDPCKGEIDRVPIEWIENEGSIQGVIHDVFLPPRTRSDAKCDVICEGRRADLIYGDDYKGYNNPRKMLLGTMRIRFTDIDRMNPREMEWKSGNSGSFSKCKAETCVVENLTGDIDDILDKHLSTSRRQLIEARVGQGNSEGDWKSNGKVYALSPESPLAQRCVHPTLNHGV